MTTRYFEEVLGVQGGLRLRAHFPPLFFPSPLLIYSEQIGEEADDACHHAGPKEHVGGHFALAFDIEEFLPRC